MQRSVTRDSLLWLAVFLTGSIAVVLPRTVSSTLLSTQKSAPAAVAVRQITLATKDLVYDPLTQRIYASVPSSAGGIGNSITQIDPVLGTIGASVPIGSEPGKLAISDNSQYIYVSLDGAAAVRRFNLATQTAGLQFSLGSGANGTFYAEDIAVMPGQPDSVAISRKYLSLSPRHGGVGIYDNGLLRPTTTATHTGSNVIEFSPTAATLYGYNNETTEAGFRKMATDASGVSVVSTTSNLILGPDIVHHNGLVYSTGGTLVNPETGTQLGTYSGVGFPSFVLPDSATNQVYFLTGSGASTSLMVFNQTTFIQTGSLNITGVSGTPGSLIKCGANRLAFRTSGNQIFILSTSEIVPILPTPIPSPTQVASGVVRLPLLTNDLVYDRNTQKVYASLPASAGSFGNSITSINPLTGTMDVPVFIGSEPGKVAISADRQFIYAALDGAAAVRRFALASQTSGLQFALGASQFNGPYRVDDLAVLPDDANAVAVSRRNLGFSPRHEGVGIYDSGIVRSTVTPVHTGSNVIEFSSSAATLFGYNNETSEFGFRKMAVNANGVSISSIVSNLVGAYGADIKYDNGRVYASTGQVINPEVGTITGTFPGVNSLAFVPDSSANRAFFITGSGGSTTLQAFDLNTFLPVGSFSIPGVSGTPGNLIRWGLNGLAFRTSGSQVFFIQTPLIQTLVNDPGDAADTNVGDAICDTSSAPGDQCTLRAAIQETNAAPGADVINFGLPGNSVITLNTPLDSIVGDLSINGPGASTLTVQRSTAIGTPRFRILLFDNRNQTITVSISGLTISNGYPVDGANGADGGGISNFNATVNLTNMVISGNSTGNGTAGSGGSGAGILNLGTMTITSSTISGNSTGSGSGNPAGVGGYGGGIFNAGTLTLINTTVSGNTTGNGVASGGYGGGIFNTINRSLTLINATISGNQAGSGLGGGIRNEGTADIKDTIVANNSASGSGSGPDLSGSFNSQDFNLIKETSGASFTGTTIHNITGVDPLLGPLAANGGPTFTHALLVGSPAIDAGNSAQTVDQRGQPRPVDDQTVVNALGGNASDIGAYEAHNLEVNSTADTDDLLCTAPGLGNGCTLREAIKAANAEAGAELITFAPALTSGGPATITLTNALADLASDMTISGPGAGLLTVQRSTVGGTPNFRIFTINSGKTVTISGLTIKNGLLTGANNGGGILVNGGTLTLLNSTVNGNRATNGGGIFNSAGVLTVTNSTVSGNTASNGAGGGINNDGGVLNLNSSTLSANTCDAQGGGVVNASSGGSGVATLTNTTVSGNTSSGLLGASVGGIANLSNSTLNLINATVSNNASGGSGGLAGGISNSSGSTARVRNTIIADNSGGFADLSGAFTSQGHNLIGFSNGSNGFTNGVNGDQVGTPALLGILASNGGPTQTQELLPGSLAIDAGDNCVVDNSCSPALTSAVTNDQRGTGSNRSADGNGDGIATVDIGAYEVQSILVTNTADSGPGSLRQAISDTNANTGTDAINFQAGLTGTITLLTALPDLSTSMLINGPGSNQLTIQRSTAGGTPQFRIFTISNSVTGTLVTISGLTLTNGSSPTIGGAIRADSVPLVQLNRLLITGNSSDSGAAGIYNHNGDMELTNCTVSNNHAALFAGGIYSTGPIFITNSTVSNNVVSSGDGGGIVNQSSQSLIINSTVSGNSTSNGAGGGIYDATGMTITNSTISNNSCDTNGCGINSVGIVYQLLNTIVAGNFRSTAGSPADDLSGTAQGSSFNLIGICNSCGLSNGVNNNQVGVTNPRLGPLANNGGPTMTQALLAGSPALDAGSNMFAANNNLTTDQRGAGFARIVDGPDADTTDTVDIGAYEAQVSLQDIVDQTINEDASLSLPLNVGGSASITSVTATSSDGALVPNNAANISISGSGSTRTLLINPLANAFGTSTITVTVNGNNSQAMTDTFLLTVNPVNDAPSFMKGLDQTVNENDGAQTVTNWASNISAGPANESGQTVNFVISSNSSSSLFAVAPAVSPFGTLTYTPAAGVSGTALIAIAIMDSGGTTNGGIDTSATQTFNINVREGGALQFSSATFSVAEDGVNALVTVTRTGGSAGEARVNYATSNGTATAGQDYASASGTLIFPDGVTTKTFNVAITNDAIDEADETVNLTLTSPAGSGSLGAPANAVLSINDNDPAPGISIDNIAITEGDSGTANGAFTVSLSAQSSQTVTVNFATANGTATAGSDYQASSGTLTFLPLETTKSVTVTVNGDISFEPDETLFVNLSNPVNATIDSSQGLATIFNDDAQGGYISFSQTPYTVGESDGFTTITVNRTNDLSGSATVEYFTLDYTGSVTEGPCAAVSNIASSRCDYTSATGTLKFAPGESSKTFLVLISQDNYVEGSESLSLNLTRPTGGALLAQPTTATLTITDDASEPATNPVDTADAFVRQHYHDFLNREPDAAGLSFWSNQITECQQPGATCDTGVRRINVSAAFFLSIEFQETGYLVYRIYKVSYGDISGAPVPVRFSEFLPDTQQISKGVVVGQTGWEQQLANNKIAFLLDFVTRPRFATAYPTTMTPVEFVDALYLNAGVTPTPSERTSVINGFGGAGNTADPVARGRALGQVAENSILKQQETNKAFVLMQYFGYLRRNPNDAPELGRNFNGYNFWLGKLNQFNGNFVNAEMVKAFIVSGEYRQRFGP